MWLFTRDGFLSVVNPRPSIGATPEQLLVRARFKGDIEAICSETSKVIETPYADYRYRAFVGKRALGDSILRMVAGIDYPNFKMSISEGWRLHTYETVWSVMAEAQREREEGR